jgi:death-on-curing protein
MGPPRFLNVSEVIDLHRHGIERYGGLSGIRDRGLLESAVFAPQQTIGGAYVYPSLAAIAAAYWMKLVPSHAFLDGNKRVGLRSADVFLMLNGYDLTLSAEEAFRLTMRIAQREIGFDELVKHVAQGMRPLA